MNVAAVIAVMRERGMSDGDILDVIEAGMSGEKARSKGAERQARYRERKTNSVTSDVTGDVTSDVTGGPLPLDKERSPTPPKENSTPTPTNLSVQRERRTHAEAFDRFWKAYPKREGSNPRKPAFEKFNTKVNAGAAAEEIIAGAHAYANAMSGRDPQFVAQAMTWLNQDRWKDYEPASTVVPFRPPDKPAMTEEEVLRQLEELGVSHVYR
jgi:hypothetical protein